MESGKKKYSTKFSIVIVTIAVIFSLPISVFAQTTPNTVNCFDYYHFGSVQVNVTANVNSVQAGSTVAFTGFMENQNSYPIVEGEVYVKIFDKGVDDSLFSHKNGYPVVDEFVVLDDINLPAKEKRPIVFLWKVPEYAQSGDYTAVLYFNSAKRFNLLGLSFADDVTGSKAPFSVVGTKEGIVSFDKESVMLNDQKFNFTTYPPHFLKDEKVTAYATLDNPRDVEAQVEVNYKLYAWDALLPDSLVTENTETVTLKPNEKKVIVHDVLPIKNTVSYLVVEAKDKDTKSILNIRFVRDGIEETRINFPSITNYPIVKGQENTVFSCAHSTNLPVVEGNILTLTLKDAKDKIIHTYVYTGDITGEMMGVKDTFVPKNSFTNFSLTAKLERGGSTIEEVTMQYDCNKIDSSLCAKSPVWLYVLLFGVSGVLIVGGTMILRKRRKNILETNTTTQPYEL